MPEQKMMFFYVHNYKILVYYRSYLYCIVFVTIYDFIPFEIVSE